MKQVKYILAIWLTILAGCCFAQDGAIPPASPPPPPPVPNSPYTDGAPSQQSPKVIQGQNASGATQETIVDEGGNLKIAPVEPDQAQGSLEQGQTNPDDQGMQEQDNQVADEDDGVEEGESNTNPPA